MRVLFFLLLLMSSAAFAQDANLQAIVDNAAQQEQPQQMTPPDSPGIPAEMQPVTYEQKKYAVLQTLDKVTARTTTITLTVGQPAAVGPIFMDVKTCQKTPPTEQPEAAAFVQVWEAKPKAYGKQSEATTSQWVFSGWMFGSSPALSSMNHPIYDVWVKDCTNELATSKEK